MSKFRSWLGPVVQALTVCLWLISTSTSAHEVSPSVADLSHQDGIVTMDIELVLEGFLASIDLSAVTDDTKAEAAATYDVFKAEKGTQVQSKSG